MSIFPDINMLQEAKTMIKFTWERPEVPEYDPDIHSPERVFAFLCYRGVHYAKWVYLEVNFNGTTLWSFGDPKD